LRRRVRTPEGVFLFFTFSSPLCQQKSSYIIINHASAGQLNCFTQLRAVVLHDRGKHT
jgi:hypothetical protein